jgi:flagellum-specific peptidoglycan hydrolase FlgJ
VGTLCKTSEHNLSDAAVDQLTAEGRYISADPPDAKGTVVHHIRDYFADYTSFDNALEHKVKLLHNKRYVDKGVLDSPRPEDFCKRIKDAGYATAVNYTQALIDTLKIVDGYAKKKKGKTVQIVQETANADIDPARFDGGFP